MRLPKKDSPFSKENPVCSEKMLKDWYIAPNPSKRVTRALAKVLGVREVKLFCYEDDGKGEFKMCKYRMEFPTMNGWVYYCNLVARGEELTAEELAKIGCTQEQRAKCQQMMEFTCGVGLVPEPKKST